jgi:hypothetical protein
MKPGRPSTYTPEIAAEILERLAAGESLRAICRDDHMPAAPTVHLWVISDVHGFAEQYTRARGVGYDLMAEGTLEIADNQAEDANSRRVRVDTRKWLLSKMLPKRYGERQTLAGDPDAPLQQRVEVVFVPSKKAGE